MRQVPYYQTYGEGASVGAFTVTNEYNITLENSTQRGRSAVSGDQVLIFGNVGDGGYETRIEATLTNLEIGQLYEISFYYSAIAFQDHYGTVNFNIDSGFDSVIDSFSLNIPDVGQGLVVYGDSGNPWIKRTIEFTADAPNQSLGLQASPTNRLGPYATFDLVEVNSIPEANSMLFCLLGLGFFAFRKNVPVN